MVKTQTLWSKIYVTILQPRAVTEVGVQFDYLSPKDQCRWWNNWVPVFDAAGVDQVTAEGWWARGLGRPPEFAVNTVCRLDPTPPPPAPLSLPALGCPPTSQTGTDDEKPCFEIMLSFFFFVCTNTFCSRLTITEPFPACTGGNGREALWMNLQSFTRELGHSFWLVYKTERHHSNVLFLNVGTVKHNQTVTVALKIN